MRPKILILLFVLVAITVIFMVWLRPSHRQREVEELPLTNQTSAVAVQGPPSQTVSNIGVPGVNSISVAFRNPQSRDSGLKDLMEKLVDGKNQPIEFYGQVIDQDSNALSGVTVESVVEQISMPVSLQGPELMSSKYIKVTRTTDHAGRFEISGLRGDGFGIGVKRDGYEAEPDHRSFGPVGGNYDSPVVFKMWSTNIHEGLITGERSFQIVPDGRRYFIKLTDGTISEFSGGDLEIWLKRPTAITFGKRYGWACGVNTMNGGSLLQEANDDESMLQAPAGDYTTSFSYREDENSSGWGDTTGLLRFYVRLNKGHSYGRISIELEAYHNDKVPSLVRLSYAVNPSGSRILR